MELAITEESPTFTKILLSGRLDTAGVDRLETKLNAVLPRDKHAVVDLSEVTFLASMGIRMLITAAKVLDRREKRLVIVAPRPLVEQALRHSSLEDILPVAQDLAGARALLGS
jgi:anti-anti-sigma factor